MFATTVVVSRLSVSVSVCVRVCEWERVRKCVGGRKRETEREKGRKRDVETDR